MPVDRWREVKQILSAALELDPGERSAFIAHACSGDAGLIQEVESLVEAYGQNQSFLEVPASVHAGLSPGARLGVYEIEELIGAGGMGEVYRAVDTSLGLAVAIKVLPALFSSDPVRLWRFEQEARAAAILHHPNILYVHQLGNHEGLLYIVSELLEGQTLRACLREGPLPLASALDFAVQIADGLAAAHDKGIVHRDLKPENLFLTRYNQIKILDFGLAKATEGILRPKSGRTPASELHRTQPGSLLGTPSYMSPEQLRGQEAVASSDLFSFGVVLYEMVTGSLPFQGETPAVISEAIMNRTPVSPRSLNPDTPHSLELIIDRALQKKPDLRYQHALEMRAELQALKSGESVPGGQSRRAAMLPILQTLSRPARRALWGLLAVALLAIPITLAVLHRTRGRVLTERDTIVLADFSNRTGESIFDDALKQGLEVDLQQSTFLNILSDGKIRRQLRFMGRSPEERLTPELARDVCRRESARAALFSSIATLGSHYVVTLKAVDCQNSEVLDEEQGEADRRENVLAQLHELGKHLRSKLGESLSSIQKHDTPLEQATTSSLEALQAYSLASRTFRSQGETPSLPLYKRAIELDPNFALAYTSLGVIYSNLNEDALATEYATKAYQLRDKVTEWERFSIDSTYYRSVTGELEKAAQVNAAWKQTYPHELAPYVNLGLIDSYLGQLEKALSDDLEGLRVTPDTARIYANLASDYMSLDRLDEADAILQEAHKRKLDDSMLPVLYQLAFLRDDESAMVRLAKEAMGKPGIEDALLASQSDTAAFHGRLAQARELSRRAVDSAVRADAKETAATWQADSALREAEFGNFAQARSDAAAAVDLASTKEVQIAAAIALARTGENTRPQSIVSTFTKRFPNDTLLNNYWLPCIRATIAIQQRQPDRAIAYLQATAPYELGGGTPPFSNGATLYPAYLRGQAYLQRGEWNAAIVELGKVLEHRGLVWNFPVGILAQLQLARAYAGLKDRDQARAHYQQFLNAWREADAGIPVYREAKAEFATLK